MNINMKRMCRSLPPVLLVAPLVLFLLVMFVFPILKLLTLSVDDPLVARAVPKTIAALADWDHKAIPDAAVFDVLARELQELDKDGKTGPLANRLNYEAAGLRGLFLKTAKRSAFFSPPYKEAMIADNPKWGTLEPWSVLERLGSVPNAVQLMAAADYQFDAKGEAISVPASQRVHLEMFKRTLVLAVLVTTISALLAYPLAYLLASAPTRISNMLMILVLLPFWTSILVRCAAWIVLLQTNGVVNSALINLGLVDPAHRPDLIFNLFGTVIVAVYVLLPYMVLPLYSTMKSIPPSLLRAASTLGASPVQGFLRVYLPLTYSGLAAGSLLVFILTAGYYITPALVGGASGTLISNLIAYHMQTSLNWGLAAALSLFLLVGVTILFALYNRLIGLGKLAMN
ncbi:ABC transporter permease [Mesorhizobium sp. M1423]|uniref:ABC transporter permease n=1 Tax=Mesorhizobium sp. M1423 TaxID=2957101 RepID=UPI0033381150